jgi:hypothetical protein
MSMQATQPLSLLHVDFDGLYARHLGRHSQFGINVAHLVSLYGLWFGVYAALYQVVLHLGVPSGWLLIVALAATYLGIVAVNAPFHVDLATAGFLAIFVASVLALPKLPAWTILPFLLMAPAFYKLQSWNHKIWPIANDMTEHNRRFPPGRTLTWILLLYEVPICLYYLLFHRQDWRR